MTSLNKHERINIFGTELTDAGLKHLSDLKELRFLDLQSTKILNDGLIALSRLNNLEEI